ncbi:MAG: pantoate--beta-alanine ligase [Chitinispirillales bacterium]|jgi:pantoate--beta-alanine ligase|nr:pantoate--beta-alanine ligase [Chitinispirillales bacterium]
MKIVNSCPEMRDYSRSLQKNGSTVGFVPTMGALHEGHLSLLKIARRHCGRVVMSVFVNPAQFGPSEDFEKYPRQLEKDCELAENAGCDCVFIPSPRDIYPENYNTYVNVENITGALCGASRPGHFRGVATVVLKLFNIVIPDTAVFGSKDAQQVIVIKRMVEDLNLPVRIIAAPTLREEDGLAMSSRNAYLSAGERADAPLIYKGLTEARELYEGGERAGQSIKNCVVSIFNRSRLLKLEYVEVVDTTQLKPLDVINRPVLIAAACRTVETGTRLIDNIVLGGDLD